MKKIGLRISVKIYLLCAVISLFLFSVFYFSLNEKVMGATPIYLSKMDTTSFSVGDGVITQGTLDLKNLDSSNWIILYLEGKVEGKEGWFYFEEDYVGLNTSQNTTIDYVMYVPTGVCDETYLGKVKAKLVSFGSLVGASPPISFSTAIAEDVSIKVTSGITCVGNPVPGLDVDISQAEKDTIYSILSKDPNEEVPDMFPFGVQIVADSRYVYLDFDGEGSLDVLTEDKVIDFGTVEIYDSSDNLLTSTDLSVTSGKYNKPTTPSFTPPEDFYLIVDTSKYDTIDPTKLDTTWEGNLYVNREGNSSYLNNAYVFNDVYGYYELVHDIDLRSRNLDQQGTWSSGTITIGPDDKDVIITPDHWDTLVEGTNYKYADLDHDGRIDPDDKDHIISPLYWDFPN